MELIGIPACATPPPAHDLPKVTQTSQFFLLIIHACHACYVAAALDRKLQKPAILC